MISKCRAIVIRTVNYSENSVVLTCFTDAFGIQTYLVNGVRSKKGSIRPSHLLPLTLLELEAYHQQNKTMQRIKELKCAPMLKEMHFNMIKSAIGIFMAELVSKTIREENHVDLPLFEFLFNAIQILDLEQQKLAAFPLYFMVQLTRYIGFFPKGKFDADHTGFDFKEGEFSAYDKRNPFQLDPVLSEKLSELIHSSFGTSMAISLTAAQRTELMELMLDYYRQHMDTFHDIKSHRVLAEVLS